jgi:hypothetical protein
MGVGGQLPAMATLPSGKYFLKARDKLLMGKRGFEESWIN